MTALVKITGTPGDSRRLQLALAAFTATIGYIGGFWMLAPVSLYLLARVLLVPSKETRRMLNSSKAFRV